MKRGSLFVLGMFVSGLLVAAPFLDVKGKRAEAASKGTKGGRVEGRVLKSWFWSANGRRVHLKDHEPAVIQRDGGFTFDRVPAQYELWVDFKGEAPVTVYRGLTRRDPVLIHSPSFVTLLDEPERKATVSGILRGDLPFPLAPGYGVTTYFLSDRATDRWGMRQQGSVGPRFGRMSVVWNGESSVSGTLLALGQHFESQERLSEAFFAQSPLQITDGGETRKELTLERLPTGRIAGEIKTRAFGTNGYLAFRVSGNRGEIGLDCKLKPGRYACVAPDLSALGGEYCMSLVDGEVGGGSIQHCGGKFGMEAFSLQIESAPRLDPLKQPGTVSKGTVLTWSGDERAVYSVKIRPDVMNRVKWFEFEVFFVGPQLAWPDLAAYGIEAPTGHKYTVKIARHYPYKSLDEMASLQGPLAQLASYQQAVSRDIELILAE